MRDLCRAREEAIRARKAAQFRRTAFLLRQDIRYTGRAAGGPAHLRWRREVVCPTPAQPIVFPEDVRAVTEPTGRPRVVIVMPAYNAARTLERTYGDIPHDLIHRIILVDDVSKDETVEIARHLGLDVIIHCFSLTDRVLIQKLPVDDPNALVVISTHEPGENEEGDYSFSYPMYQDLRDRNDVLSGLVAYLQRPFSLSDGTHAERVTGQIVSGNYFDVLGVRPAIGRFFATDEDRTPGTHAVAVISHGLWRRRFGADPSTVGRSIGLNGYTYSIIGVAPPEFAGTSRGTVTDVYVPAMMQAQAILAPVQFEALAHVRAESESAAAAWRPMPNMTRKAARRRPSSR